MQVQVLSRAPNKDHKGLFLCLERPNDFGRVTGFEDLEYIARNAVSEKAKFSQDRSAAERGRVERLFSRKILLTDMKGVQNL